VGKRTQPATASRIKQQHICMQLAPGSQSIYGTSTTVLLPLDQLKTSYVLHLVDPARIVLAIILASYRSIDAHSAACCSRPAAAAARCDHRSTCSSQHHRAAWMPEQVRQSGNPLPLRPERPPPLLPEGFRGDMPPPTRWRTSVVAGDDDQQRAGCAGDISEAQH
jgi:hypothetical protein